MDETIKREFGANPALPIAVVVQAPPNEVPAWWPTKRRSIQRASGEPEHVRLLYLGHSTWVVAIAPRGDPFSTANERLVKRLRAVPAALPGRGRRHNRVVRGPALEHLVHLPIAIVIIALTMFATIFAMTGSAVLPVKTSD